jgi:hypothetical protein
MWLSVNADLQVNPSNNRWPDVVSSSVEFPSIFVTLQQDKSYDQIQAKLKGSSTNLSDWN